MNFFEHQDWARRRTALLVLLFVVAVALVVVVTNVAVFAVLQVSNGRGVGSAGLPDNVALPLFLAVGAGVVLLIGSASGIKMLSLRRGGGAVAEMLGGRLVNELTDDPDERRLVNVVEEMAIASGTPVPLIYVLDNEPGINAFAAGHGSEDAAVAVTRGALEQFTRDELQGVMAHEFSHILNRDVRLNTRLTGLIFGILVLTIAGRLLLRGGAHARIGRSSDRGGGAGAAVAIGLVLVIVGYIGVFFSRLIKQAVSRQREYLADASAVQFTRNPDGLASALKRIGGWHAGSVVTSPSAEEIGHFFFADGLKPSFLGGLLSTHPPLEERIRRLDPQFVAEAATAARISEAGRAAPEGVASLAGGMARPPRERPQIASLHPTDRVVERAAGLTANVGTTRPEKLVYDEIIDLEVPVDIRRRTASAFGAVSVVFSMLLDDDPGRRNQQLTILRSYLQKPMVDEIAECYPEVAAIDRFLRLPVVDMAMPALRGMSSEQYERLTEAMDVVIEADDHLTLHEYAVRSIVGYRLAQHFGKHTRKRPEPHANVAADVHTVLSGLAWIGNDGAAQTQEAYDAAVNRVTGTPMPGTPARPKAVAIDAAVQRLSRLPMKRKEQIVDACAHCVLSDDHVTLDEAELLRVIIVALGCPLPPFLPVASA